MPEFTTAQKNDMLDSISHWKKTGSGNYDDNVMVKVTTTLDSRVYFYYLDSEETSSMELTRFLTLFDPSI